jgi:hypothetical protein
MDYSEVTFFGSFSQDSLVHKYCRAVWIGDPDSASNSVSESILPMARRFLLCLIIRVISEVIPRNDQFSGLFFGSFLSSHVVPGSFEVRFTFSFKV